MLEPEADIHTLRLLSISSQPSTRNVVSRSRPIALTPFSPYYRLPRRIVDRKETAVLADLLAEN